MYRREFLGASIAAALVMLPAGAFAQQQSAKDRFVGAWTLLLVDGIDAENMHHPLFGPNPEGILITTANGNYAVEVMRTINRPRFASNNRDKGTTDENAATAQGTLAYFGTYTIDPAGKTLTQRIEGSTFPNQEGTKQTWNIAEITDEVITIDLPIAQSTIPGQGGYRTIEVIWKKLK